MLTLDGVSKSYKVGTFGGKELPAVRDVSFEVGAGEVVSLIGESGSGKTTIGKMILRLIGITGGRIDLDGNDISAIKGASSRPTTARSRAVFQDPFSSFNPMFKADHVLGMMRDEYFPGVAADGLVEQGRGVARGRDPQPGPGAQQIPPPAERRPAPAPPHRPGAPARDRVSRRRRDHQHARRLDPDRRPQPARRAQGAGSGHPVHHP